MKKSVVRAFVAVLALSLFAAACGGSDSSSAESDADDVVVELPRTVADVTQQNGAFTTLFAALTEADLVDTLKGDGPFTVLAPTDAVFAETLETLGLTAEELLARPDLASILTYHVIPGSLDQEALKALDGQAVETVNGATIDITVVNGVVRFNDDIRINTGDNEATNGVIHFISGVLLPE